MVICFSFLTGKDQEYIMERFRLLEQYLWWRYDITTKIEELSPKKWMISADYELNNIGERVYEELKSFINSIFKGEKHE